MEPRLIVAYALIAVLVTAAVAVTLLLIRRRRERRTLAGRWRRLRGRRSSDQSRLRSTRRSARA